MKHDTYSDDYIRSILTSVKTIAVVGASAKEARPSHGVMKFLLDKGYEVIPVNPGQAGKEILGQMTHASLADLPGPVDMIDIFRASAAVPGVTDEILAMNPLPKVVWMQLSVRDDASAARLEERGIRVVMDRCPKIELGRLSRVAGSVG